MMSPTLELLVSSRSARRERAIAELAEARRQFAQADRRCEQAQLDVDQCARWRDELRAGCGLGQAPIIRDSALPACEALLQRRRQDLDRARKERRAAQDGVAEKHLRMAAAQRADLRLQEWRELMQVETQRHGLTQENLDDDLPPGAG
jgi:hypothetical protein